MKRILTFIAVSIMGGAVFTGCTKYDYNASMAATINGAKYKCSGTTRAFAQVDTNTHTPQLVIINGTSDTYTPGTAVTPVIKLVAPHSIGTYTIDTNDVTVGRTRVYTSATGSTGTVAISGEIKILNIKDGKIMGNFSLTCADGTIVKDGQYVVEEGYY